MASHASFDLVEQQQAFVGLLTRPLLTPEADPELHRRVARHRAVIATWAGRLGYRLVSIGSTFRLRRPPIDHAVAFPAAPSPPRRELVLGLVVAACLEDIGSDAVTIQAISDAVRDLTTVGRVTAYDPERRAERVSLVRSIGRLSDLGVLERRTQRDDLVREWESSGHGPGAGYHVNRDALVLMVDPTDVARQRRPAPNALDDVSPFGSEGDSRSAVILRGLIETQGLVFAELDEGQLDYFKAQRHRLLARAAEMTGGMIESRGEGVVLVIPPDGPHAAAATVDFPAATAAAWVSLHVIDAAATFVRTTGSSARRDQVLAVWPSAAVDAAAARIHGEFGERLTSDLRGDADAVRRTAEQVLGEAGLIRATPDGDWLLSPLMGRYRDAVLQTGPHAVTGTLTDDD